MATQDLNRLLLRPGDLSLSPAAGASAFSMLHQEMTATDLSLALTEFRPSCRSAVVVGHVDLELFGVGVRRGLPAGFFGGGTEVVGEVLGVGVANLPSCWKTCFDLKRDWINKWLYESGDCTGRTMVKDDNGDYDATADICAVCEDRLQESTDRPESNELRFQS